MAAVPNFADKNLYGVEFWGLWSISADFFGPFLSSVCIDNNSRHNAKSERGRLQFAPRHDIPPFDHTTHTQQKCPRDRP